MPQDPIHVEGLGDLRRSLRQMGDKETLKAVQQVTKRAAQTVADDARTLAPRRSGRLAAGFRGTTSGNSGVVRNRVPYAKVHEFGGTIKPRGVPITIRKSGMTEKALDRNAEQIVRQMEDELEDIARRTGWT